MAEADRLRSDTHLPVFKGSSRLSPRELKIVKCLAQGLTNREISQRTGIGHLTLKNRLFRIFDKLGVSSRLELLSLTMSKTSPSGGGPIGSSIEARVMKEKLDAAGHRRETW
jgi:DNA-binding NarL/FixJ family response regulator